MRGLYAKNAKNNNAQNVMLQVVVKPNAREVRVEKGEGNSYRVWVTAPPVEGKANEAVVEALGEFFGAAKSRFRIVSGHKGRNKIVEFE